MGTGGEEALLQSQERNRVIVDTALDAVISMDAGASLPVECPGRQHLRMGTGGSARSRVSETQ